MKKIELLNRRFGKLVVIGISPKLNCRQLRWICKCDCGKEKIVQGVHLRTGHTKSCGCEQYTYGEKHPTWKGYKKISSRYFGSIKTGAKNRNHEFNLNIEYLWELFLKQNKKCSLTGELLNFEENHGKIKGNASLDRISSSIGYIEGNVQWVLKDINMMKQEYSMDYFLQLCEQVTKYKNERNSYE